MVWPGAVLCDRSAFSGPVPVNGWLFVCHPDPSRHADLILPGIVISPRVGPGKLPGDIPLPDGLFQAGTARSLVENLSRPGRPPVERPARQAGTDAVEDRIDDLARTGGAGRIRNVLGELDVIAGSFDPRAVDLVRRRLAAVLGTASDDAPLSGRLKARLAGQPYDTWLTEPRGRQVQNPGSSRQCDRLVTSATRRPTAASRQGITGVSPAHLSGPFTWTGSGPM